MCVLVIYYLLFIAFTLGSLFPRAIILLPFSVFLIPLRLSSFSLYFFRPVYLLSHILSPLPSPFSYITFPNPLNPFRLPAASSSTPPFPLIFSSSPLLPSTYAPIPYHFTSFLCLSFIPILFPFSSTCRNPPCRSTPAPPPLSIYLLFLYIFF